MRVLAHRRSTFRNPLVGRALPLLIAQAGLTLGEVMAVPIVHRSFAAARGSGGPFDMAVRNAVNAGAISATEGDRYLRSLEELDPQGAFFFAAMAIAALARKD